MTERVKRMREFLLQREYRKTRSSQVLDFAADIRETDDYGLFAAYLRKTLENETPRFYGEDLFGFHRSHANYGVCLRDGVDAIPSHIPCNVTPNYGLLMQPGLEQVLQIVRGRSETARDDSRRLYLAAAATLEALLEFAEKYRQAAKEAGNERLYQALCNVPKNAPGSFYEACVFQKIIIFALRITKHDHITFGRFDQYMYPYFRADLERGVSEEELFETLELYFLSLNMDTDTYRGIQMGDNGQSMVLGGYDAQGNDMYNKLSQMCMEASLELEVIDPKINLRVNKTTPEERYLLGTRLTQKGLGFPQ